MAEPFGITTGALGLVSLFTSCVDCFDYIQLGRHFGKDYQRSLLKLDIVANRLSRWGESIGLYNQMENSDGTIGLPVKASALDIQTARNSLGEILDLFTEVQKKSKKFELKAQPEDLVIPDPDNHLDALTGPLHRQMKGLMISRQKRARLRQEGATVKQVVSWALYEKKNCDRLIEDITTLVDGLIEMFPEETWQAQRKICTVEISEIKDIPSVEFLMDVSGEDDKLLKEVAKQAIKERTGHVYRGNVITCEAKVRQGDEYAESWTRMPGQNHAPGHVYENNRVESRARVHMGNSYGGKSVLDD